MQRWSVIPLIVGACAYDPIQVLPVDAALDAAPPDPRPLGVIDGSCEGQPGRPRVLVYTYENMWRHLSNWYARETIFDMCETRGFHIISTNDPKAINATRLADADVVVFAVTSGSGLDPLAQADLEAWIGAGGGYVGLEAAAATEMQWPFYIDNVGAGFAGHPPNLYLGTVAIEPVTHPITAGLSAMSLVEQWYIFQRRPEEVPGIQVLLTLDETTLPPEFPVEYRVGYHAIGWAHERLGGRVFYTGLGDNPVTFSDPTMIELLGRAIEWTAGAL